MFYAINTWSGNKIAFKSKSALSRFFDCEIMLITLHLDKEVSFHGYYLKSE